MNITPSISRLRRPVRLVRPVRPAPSSGLRVCVVASASLPIPPFDGYGGTQRGIHDVVETLRSHGHHVTLCGPGDSTTVADEHITPLPRSLWSADSPYSTAMREQLAEVHAREVANAIRTRHFDVINVRYDHYGLVSELVRQGRAPIVYSLHNVASDKTTPIVRDFAGRIAITAHCEAHRAQFTAAAGDNDVDVLFYGMNVGAYPFGAEPLAAASEHPTLALLRQLRAEGRDYVLSLGRIAAEKGQASAIEIARAAGVPLIIAGAPFERDPEGQSYLEREVLPHVDGRNVHLFGSANELQKRELLRFAKGLLFTSGLERGEWKEPFGRVLMEALATGTPVVAHGHGSAPEIVTSEVGFLCRDVASMVAGVRQLGSIDRGACRRYAKRFLSRERMARDCERLFRRAVEPWAAAAAGERRLAVGGR